jgi:hypothetical protein
MIPEPPTPDFSIAPVRVLVQDGKPLVPGAEQLIAEKEAQPMRPVEKRRFIADFPRTSKKQRQQDREAAKKRPTARRGTRTTSDTPKIAPTPACARETGIPAKLGNRLRDPEPAVIRRGLENKRAKATRKVAELAIRLEAERVKLAGIVDSLGRLG